MAAFLMGLGIFAAVAVHEAGHLIAAKRSGVAVTEACWGFGPKLWSRQIGETVYALRVLPLGGYIRPASERHGNVEWLNGSPIPESRWVETAAPRQRIVMFMSGVAANVGMAVALLWIVALAAGTTHVSTAVGEVVADSAADRAGLETGDRLVSIGNAPVVEWEDVGETVRSLPGESTTVTIERNNREVTLGLTLGTRDGHGFLGVSPALTPKTYNGFTAFGWAIENAALITREAAVVALKVFNPGYVIGLLTSVESPEPVDSERPVSLIGAFQASSSLGGEWPVVVTIVAIINVCLALFNLLPLPPLDGSHVVVETWEMTTKKKVPIEVFAAAAAPVLAWMVFVTGILVFLDLTAPVL